MGVFPSMVIWRDTDALFSAEGLRRGVRRPVGGGRQGPGVAVHLEEMTRTRTPTLGPAARPVAVPGNLEDPALPKARGRVELPRHIRWSGPPITYDLADRSDRARVYEQVLREGTEDDVRRYVELEKLRELLDELVLPPSVRRAWVECLRGRYGDG